jgi:hypothetical protein
MREFLLIVGLVFTLVGFIATMYFLTDTDRFRVDRHSVYRRHTPAIADVLLCTVPYTAGFFILYFRNRLAKGE